MSKKRILVSAAAGILLSLLVFMLGKSNGGDWHFLPELPGLFVAMFALGAHNDNVRALNGLMLTVNTAFYGSVVFACYPLFVARRKRTRPNT
jgi:hypothetical protein